MLTSLTPIGNSQGIRIPQHMLRQIKLTNQIEIKLEIKGSSLVLTPVSKNRKKWHKLFQNAKKSYELSKNKETQDLSPSIILDHSWDTEEWTW